MKTILTSIILFISTQLLAQEVELFSEQLNIYQNVRDFCISPNQQEAFFTLQSSGQELSQIVTIRKIDHEWTTPQLLPFSNSYNYLEPFLSYDGLKLYFVSDRPLYNSISVRKDYDIWYVERSDINSPWSVPINLGIPVNSKYDEFYPTLTENKHLYFTMESPSGLGKDDIYFCLWNGKEYSKPQLLDSNINSSGYEFNAFISKDDSFLLYTKYNAEDGLGSGDLYISKKDKNGQWQKSENLGNIINTKYMEYCPFYDEENEILYFTSRRNLMEHKSFNDLAEFQNYISGANNGLSKIYKIKIALKQ